MNKMTTALVAALAIAAVSPVARAGEEAPVWPKGDSVARVGDRAVSTAEFTGWLLATRGPSYLEDYLRQTQAEVAAAQLGVTITADKVAEDFKVEWDTNVTRRHKGDEAAFVAELRENGHTRATFGYARRAQIRAERLLAEIAIASRDVGPAAIEAAFTRVMPGGERLAVQVLYVHRRALLDDPRRLPAGNRPTSYDEIDQVAREYAESLRQRLLDGAPFDELAAEGSDEPRSLHAPFVRDRFPEPIGVTADGLEEPGAVSDVVAVQSGYFVLQLVDKRSVTMEQVETELIEVIRSEPIQPQELVEAQARCDELAPITREDGD